MKKRTYLSMTLLVVYVWKEMCHMCCCWKTFRKYIKTMYWGIRLLTLLHWRNYPLLVIIVSAEYVFMVWYQFWGFVVQVVNLLFRKYHAHFASVALKPMWLIVLSLLSPLSVVLKICSFFCRWHCNVFFSNFSLSCERTLSSCLYYFEHTTISL